MAILSLFKNSKDDQTFGAGQTIFKEGDRGDSMFIVLDGEVDVLVRGELMETVRVGGLFGEMALLVESHERSATAMARSNCTVVPINQRRFNFLVQETPGFALDVMRVMVERIRRNDPR